MLARLLHRIDQAHRHVRLLDRRLDPFGPRLGRGFYGVGHRWLPLWRRECGGPAIARGGGAPKISAPVLRKSTAPAPPVHRRKETKPSMMAEFMKELQQDQEGRDARGEKSASKRGNA